MDRLSDIGMMIWTVIDTMVTLVICLLLMIAPPVILVSAVLLLIKLLGPVMGFLAALALGTAIGVIIQDTT